MTSRAFLFLSKGNHPFVCAKIWVPYCICRIWEQNRRLLLGKLIKYESVSTPGLRRWFLFWRFWSTRFCETLGSTLGTSSCSAMSRPPPLCGCVRFPLNLSSFPLTKFGKTRSTLRNEILALIAFLFVKSRLNLFKSWRQRLIYSSGRDADIQISSFMLVDAHIYGLWESCIDCSCWYLHSSVFFKSRETVVMSTARWLVREQVPRSAAGGIGGGGLKTWLGAWRTCHSWGSSSTRLVVRVTFAESTFVIHLFIFASCVFGRDGQKDLSVFGTWSESVCFLCGRFVFLLVASWPDIRRLESVWENRQTWLAVRASVAVVVRSPLCCCCCCIWKRRKLVFFHPSRNPRRLFDFQRVFAHIFFFGDILFWRFFMARWSTLVVALALFAAVSTAETQGKMMTNLVISKTFFVQRHSRRERERENRFFFCLDCVIGLLVEKSLRRMTTGVDPPTVSTPACVFLSRLNYGISLTFYEREKGCGLGCFALCLLYNSISLPITSMHSEKELSGFVVLALGLSAQL